MLNSLRFLCMNDFTEINRMTLYEYNMKMTAFRLRQADREYESHLQAWVNREIKAKREAGKKKLVPVYKTFKQFFDLEKRTREILRAEEPVGINTKSRGIYNLMKKQKERRHEDGNL